MKIIAVAILLLTLAAPAIAKDDPYSPTTNTGRVGWALVLGTAATYEVWAVSTKHQTLSQSVQHGPKWFKVSLGVGLGALAFHMFF